MAVTTEPEERESEGLKDAAPTGLRHDVLLGDPRDGPVSGLAGRLGDHRRLFDSIAALGLMIAFYYGLTGFACTIYYRHELFSSVKAFFLIGVGPPLIIGLGFLVMGALLMLWWRFGHPAFFRRKPEVADPALVRRVGLDD